MIREVVGNEYGWNRGNRKNTMLDQEGMEKSDRKKVEKYLKSMSLMSESQMLRKIIENLIEDEMTETKLTVQSESIIYCDMDGVLVDFENSTVELVNQLLAGEPVPGVYPDKKYFRLLRKVEEELGPDFELSSGSDLSIKSVRNFMFYVISIDPGGFYGSLPPLDDGVNQLWPYLNGTGHSVKLLTAGVSGKPGSSTSEEGKRAWAMENLKPPPGEVIQTPAKQKSESALTGDVPHVLIDDKNSTIQSWNDTGGIGILHIPGGSASTIAQLREIGL
jgi:hypothetical protein